MASPLLRQNIIAIIWDFDKTLIPGYMQEPLFRYYNVDGGKFWREVNALPEAYNRRGAEKVSRDTIYLNHILTYVRAGVFKGLSNARLREFGREIEFYEGIPEIFQRIYNQVTQDPEYRRLEISIEHYVVSTGLRQVIMGSKIRPFIKDVWGCEYVEGAPGPDFIDDPQPQLIEATGEITDIAYAIDNTTKTRAVFEINKGTNVHPEIEVNTSIKDEHRRIPFRNMIYIADGPSDVPVFSVVSRSGGKTFAVYKPQSDREFEQVNELQAQGRIHAFGEALYTEGSHTSMWIRTAVRQVADRIVREHQQLVGDNTGRAPGHVDD